MSPIETYSYQSIKQRYSGSDASDLQLRVTYYNNNSIEIELINQHYTQNRQSKVQQLLALLCLYCSYCIVVALFMPIKAQIFLRCTTIDIGFLLVLLYTLCSTFNLVKSEKLLFCMDFGLVLKTERFWSRQSNYFISAVNLHDIVLNEVVEDLDIHYILILRTHGSLFKQKPIIPIFHTLWPTIECLEMVYRHINKILSREGRPSHNAY